MEIVELGRAEAFILARIIRESFETVAKEFGLTPENCPTNGAFIQGEKVERDMESGSLFYGVLDGDVIAGVVEITKKSETALEMQKLAVLPAFRHKGYGRALVDFTAAYAGQHGFKTIQIGIIDGNMRLKNWYAGLGFVHTGTREFAQLPFVVGFMELAVQ